MIWYLSIFKYHKSYQKNIKKCFIRILHHFYIEYYFFSFLAKNLNLTIHILSI